LRERAEDIPAILDHFLRRYVPERVVRVSDEARDLLVRYSWPGNVRELRNVVQRMALFADGEITAQDLPPEIRTDLPLDMMTKACLRCFTEEQMSFEQVMVCLETNLLQHALHQSGGNRTRPAKALGLNLSTLRDKLKKHNLGNSKP
jgi:DNA-binding NtrC family response regulator